MKITTSTLINAILATILLTSVSFAFIPSALAEKRFVVSPTGIDDTANIQAAFDAAVASGPGSTVQLKAGTFYLSEPIVVANFDGTFKGAGKDKTIVQTLGEDPFPLVPPPFSPHAVVFTFYQDTDGVPSHISFKDMTIRAVGESAPWSPHGLPPANHMNLIEVRGRYTGVEDFDLSYVSTSVKRMRFEGQIGASFIPFGYNALYGLEVWGEDIYEIIDGSSLIKYIKETIGTHTVKDSSFENVMFAIDFAYLKDSTVKVEDNKFDNVGGWAFGLTDISNTQAKFIDNDVHTCGNAGVWVEQGHQAVWGWDLGPIGDLPELSSVLVKDNTIRAVEFADGVIIIDWASMVGAGKRVDAVISDNTMSLDTWYGGVWGYFAQDVKVLDNDFEGIGWYGISVGTEGDPSSGWQIIDNDMEDLEADMAHIWLGPDSSDCFVKGEEDTVVLDEGTDNTIIIED